MEFRSEDLRAELQGNSERSQPTETKDDAEARIDFWSMERDFIYRHHVEPRVQLFVPKEESFPIPLKYIDVTRTTHTNLDVLQESRIDDHWDVDVDRSLSDSGTGFTKFASLNKKKTFQRICGQGGLQRFKQLPDLICGLKFLVRHAESSSDKSKNGPLKKPKLDNARRLRGINFTDPEDGEYKETIKDARKRNRRLRQCLATWERRSTHQKSCGKPQARPKNATKSKRQSMHASWKLMNPQESVWNLLYQKNRKITSRRKGSIL